jgi:rhamnosyltransferase
MAIGMPSAVAARSSPPFAPRPRIASVTVTFNPDPARLRRQVEALDGQVDEILIVDNGSAAPLPELPAGMHGVRLFALEENRGVASGFNIGMREARARGARFVLLLDHDSIPSPDMVAQLVDGYHRAQEASAAPIVAVGPCVVDVRDRREYPFIRLGWLRNAHLRCSGAERVPCDFLISSGALIALEHVPAIGEFDESLFIDSVDFEWCCRARSRGFALVGICAARLDHWLGDERREVLGAIALVVHSPQRLYYMTRNRLLLYRRRYIPIKWKVKDVLRLLGKFLATMVLLPSRAAYARMTWLAIRDGLAGRCGKL